MPDVCLSASTAPFRLLSFRGRPQLTGRVVIAGLQGDPRYVAFVAVIGDEAGWERDGTWFREHDGRALLEAAE